MRVNFWKIVAWFCFIITSLVHTNACADNTFESNHTTTAFVTETIAKAFWEATVTYIPTNRRADPIVGTRTIKFVNQCPFTVWFGLSSGSVRSKLGATTICNTEADCYSGSKCIQTGAIRQCFWINPQPANGDFRLAANGGTNSVSIPIFQNNLNTAWTGVIAGRTNCTSAGCETADCGTGTNSCTEGRGFLQPATQVEFALQNQSHDFYDVESINGMNIPMMVSPNIPTQMLKKVNNPFTCGSPGAVAPVTQLGRCTWNMYPPRVEYQWVAKGGSQCTSNSNCTAPNLCGLSFDAQRSPQLLKTCGKLLGYWTANQICGVDPNYGYPFNCSRPLYLPQSTLKMSSLYACAPINSCYLNGASSNCCGCANWSQLGVDIPGPPYVPICVDSNSIWTSFVRPGLLWLKYACPTMYVYPYDDKSATFTCQVIKNDLNLVDYTVTYCPSGKTGGVQG